MASETLSSLLIDLKLSTASLKKGADDANKKLESIENQTKKTAKSMKSLEVKEVFSAIKDGLKVLGQFVLAGAETADKMGKMSQSIGISVESLSALDYAAGLSGVATDELGSSLGKLNKALAEADSGGKQQAAVFAALGVAVTDSAGRIRTTEDVIGDVANKFAGMKDGAAKTAYAMELFGKSGANMIPFLNQGKAGIKELTDEAARLGVVMSSKTARDAEAFNDAVDKLHRAMNGVAVQVASQLAPALTALIDKFMKSGQAGDTLKMAATGIAGVFKILVSAGLIVAAIFEGIGKAIARIGSAIANFISGNFEEAIRETARGAFFADLQESLTAALDNIQTVWTATGDSAEQSGNRQRQSIKMVNAALDEQKKKLADARLEMEAGLKVKFAEINRDAASRQQSFNNIRPTGGVWGGFRDSAAFTQATKGFKDFNDALARSTQATKNYESYTAEAGMLQKEGQAQMAASAKLAADAHKALADKANAAAAAFENKTREQAAATDDLVNHFTAKLGKLGDVISVAQKGFQAGGVWGAVGAVALELLTGTEEFQKIVDQLDGMLNALGQALAPILVVVNQVVGALRPLMSALGRLVESVMKLLNAFLGVAYVGDLLAPIVNLVAIIIEPIIQLIQTFSDLFERLKIFDFAVSVVSVVLNSISLVILTVIRGVQGVFNFILQTVRDIVAFIGVNTSWFDTMLSKNATAMADTDTKMRRIWNDIANPNAATSTTKMIDGLNPVVVNTTNSIEKLGNAADEVTEQLLNVPSGYKVAAARFMASEPADSGWTNKAKSDVNERLISKIGSAFANGGSFP